MYNLPQACNFIKKETLAKVFSCEFFKISRNTFLHRTPLVAASELTSRTYTVRTFNCSQNLLQSRSGIYLVKNINTAPDLFTKFTLVLDIFFFSFTASTARSLIYSNYITNSRKKHTFKLHVFVKFSSRDSKSILYKQKTLRCKVLTS